jgi:nitrogenase iron protein NifH
LLRKNGDATLDDLVTVGSGGVLCVESGGPVPGVGCAGRGIITAFEKLEELNVFEVYQPDVVMYDVLGDVVCGGFAMPIRGGYADEVCIVTSGEMMSLYAASNIAYAVKSFGVRGYATLKGLILNAKSIENEDELVGTAAREMETSILYRLPRDSVVQQAEALGKTVTEVFPEGEMAAKYRELAGLLMKGDAND